MNLARKMHYKETQFVIAALLVVLSFLYSSLPAYALFGFEKKEKKSKITEASVMASKDRASDPEVSNHTPASLVRAADEPYPAVDESQGSPFGQDDNPVFETAYRPQNVIRPVDLPVTAVPRPVETFSSPLPTEVPSAVQDTQMLQIQTQIKDIIRLNETLKQRYDSQAAEIQKITEQAKIHQRILNELETTRSSAPVETQLLDEKVRIIGQETQKNKELLSSISQISASKDAKR